MLIRGRSTRVSQPTGPVEIDWSDPLADGLVLDARGDLGFTDGAGGRAPTQAVGQLTRQATPFGVAAGMASAVATFGDVELFTGAKATWQIIELPNSVSDVNGIVNKRAAAASQNSFSFGYNFNGSDFTVDVGDPTGTAVNVSYRFDRTPLSTAGNNLIVCIDGSAGAGAKVKVYRNGSALSLTSAAADIAFSTFPNTTAPLDIGRVNNGTLYYAGRILLVRAWNGLLSLDGIARVSENANALYRPVERRVWFSDVGGGGATNYTLTASAGSYSLTGIDATLTYTPAAVNYSLTADVGAYALSGVDATLTYTVAGTAYTLSADAGAYSLTGVDATLSYVPGSGAYTLTADTGSYTLNGSDAGLTFARRMAADVGSYTLTGVDAGLQLGRRLTADTGVYALAGVDAVLTYTSTAPTAYTLACEAGSYALSGVDARFLVNGVAEASAHGFVLVDMPSSMWWKRKPKAITEEVAKKKIKRVVRAIEQATRAQVAQPAAQQQREVYQAIAPLLEEMPGFDWKQVFRLIVAQDTARRQMEATIARAKQIEQDDEDVLMLLLSH